MRRLILLALVLCVILSLSLSASAAVGATGCRIDAILDADGNCQVTVTAALLLETTDGVSFPIPGNARAISLGGSGVSTRPSGDALLVDLSRMKGTTMVLRYTVPNCVSYNEKGKPQLTLPLLSGFAYPMDGLDFTLTLPEMATANPHFFSGYHQQGIEGLVWEVRDNQIAGYLHSTLNDRETMSMTLELTEATFPRSAVEPWSAGLEDTLAFVFMGLAFLYWLLFLRAAPFIRRKGGLPPEGSTAGELRCALTGQGADLTMMVFSWAQLGYILIQLKGNGRVILHKRMDMGNERGAFEQKIFRALFSRKRSVDGSGYHYARLCRKVAASRGSLTELFRKTSGNPLVFRALAAVAGLFGGTSLAIALAGDALLAFLIILIMSVLGAIGSWVIQDWVQGLHLRNRTALLLGLGISLGWVLLGVMAGEAGMALGVVAFQLAVGLFWAYGGRRTPVGRQNTAQVLGLRAYLRRIPEDDLDRIRRNEPDYFFTMAPYALALGVEIPFARHFGRSRMNPCPWLTSGMDGHMTAQEWALEMRRAAASLDEHQKRLPWERLMGR